MFPVEMIGPYLLIEAHSTKLSLRREVRIYVSVDLMYDIVDEQKMQSSVHGAWSFNLHTKLQ